MRSPMAFLACASVLMVTVAEASICEILENCTVAFEELLSDFYLMDVIICNFNTTFVILKSRWLVDWKSHYYFNLLLLSGIIFHIVTCEASIENHCILMYYCNAYYV